MTVNTNKNMNKFQDIENYSIDYYDSQKSNGNNI